jgi:hypothetical protein
MARSLMVTNLLRFAGRSLTRPRLTVRHAALLLALATLYPPYTLLNWIGLWLDDLLFPSWRTQAIPAPLFILGNFRSGTTYLHRLLARDRQTFTTMRLWEILFAPSVTGRRLWQRLGALDQRLGGRSHRWLACRERRWDAVFDLHRTSLWAPEEDEHLMLHIWSTGTTWMWAGLLEEMGPYVHFDAMPAPDKDRIMRFFRRCVQAQLYAQRGQAGAGGGPRTYLSKSPPFAGKVKTLDAWFPDARFAYIVRSPLQVIPSFISFLQRAWQLFGLRVKQENACEQVIEIVAHWYAHPLAYLERLPADRAHVLRFDDLVRAPRHAVEELYGQFGLTLSPQYLNVLQEATERSRRYSSPHRFELDDLGLSREAILDRFRDLIDRYDLDN